MKLTKNSLLGTIGGLAVLAGAGFYLYQRKIRNKSPFQKFKESFLMSKLDRLPKLQSQFDALFYQEVGQYTQVVEYLQNKGGRSIDNEGNPHQKSRYCGKVIDQGYRCYDCYPESQFSKELNEIKLNSPESQLLHAVCEDCFDQQIHKNHKFEKEDFNMLTYCDCGISEIYKEKSFCAEHCGFKDLKKEYSDHFPVEIKAKMISFFDKLISLLIDFAEQSSQSSQKYDETYSEEFNILLNLIQNLVIQLIKEDNCIYTYFFQEYFLKMFSLPNKIDINNTQKLTFLSADCATTTQTKQIPLLDILFMLFPLMNEYTVGLLNQIFREIGSADFTFYSDLAIKFQQYHECIFNVFLEENKQYAVNQDLIIRIMELFVTFANGRKIHELKYKLVHENEDDLLNLMKMQTKITKNQRFQENLDIEYHLILQYYFYNEGFWISPSDLNNSKHFLSFVQEIVNQLIFFAGIFQLGGGGQRFQEDFVSRQIPLFINLLFGQCSITFMAQLIDKLVLANNHELSNKVQKLLSENYLNQVNRIYQETLIFEKTEQKPRFHLGIQLLYLILFIMILDKQPFNREGLKNMIKRNFPSLQTDQEIVEFADKVLHLLRNYVPSTAQSTGESLTADIILQKTIQGNDLEYWQTGYAYFWNPKFGMYDQYMLTLQIFQLLGSSPKRDPEKEILETPYSAQERFVRFQLHFDQTPLLNKLLSSSDQKYLLKSDDESMTINIDKAVQSTIIGVIQTQSGSSASQFSTVVEEIAKFFKEESLIQKSFAVLCDVQKQKNQFKLKEKLPDSFHLFNQGRMFNFSHNQYLQRYLEHISYMSKNRKFYLDMFDYQKQLFIKGYANIDFFKDVLKLVFSEKQSEFPLIFYMNQELLSFSVLIEMSMQQELKELFTEKEYEDTQKIEEQLYSESNMKILISEYKKALKEPKFESQREHVQLFFDFYESIHNRKYPQPNIDQSLQKEIS